MMINMKKGQFVKLVKLSDDAFGGNHPNGIDEGYTRIGELMSDLEVGGQCLVLNLDMQRYLRTSTITEIVNENTFKTLNSTYSINVVEKMPKIMLKISDL